MNNCILTVKSTSVVVTGGNLEITIPEVTLTNHQPFRLIICQSIPADAAVDQVILINGTTQIPMLVRTGNYLRADQVRCRRCYDLVYGNNPIHASLLFFVPRSCYDVVNVTAPTPTPTETADTVAAQEVAVQNESVDIPTNV